MIALFDFEDSFTYNLYSDLKKFLSVDFGDIKVFHWTKLTDLKLQDYDLIVLGPGPGHPDEYSKIFPTVRSLISDKTNCFFAVCLGHQVLWRSLGAKVERLKSPIHGQGLELNIPLGSIWSNQQLCPQGKCLVQLYNSLSVDISHVKKLNICLNLLDRNNQLYGCHFKNGLSYQFHPESVGTSCPDLFFRAMTKISYNKFDGLKNRRHIRP